MNSQQLRGQYPHVFFILPGGAELGSLHIWYPTFFAHREVTFLSWVFYTFNKKFREIELTPLVLIQYP